MNLIARTIEFVGARARSALLALACVFAMALTAPDAEAAQKGPKAGQAPAPVEAPAEEPVASEDEDCTLERRRGGRFASRSALHCERGEVEARAMFSGCASRVAYRGHRRVHIPLRNCRPLFARASWSGR